MASAFLIGTTKHRGKNIQNRHSDNSYISSLKQHLTQLNVEISSYKPNYHGSQDDLHQQMSKFFSRSDPSLFILYYSGPTNEKGDWFIATTDGYGEETTEDIRFDYITKWWKATKADSNSYLLIILDAENTKAWRKKWKSMKARVTFSFWHHLAVMVGTIVVHTALECIHKPSLVVKDMDFFQVEFKS